jgi:O-acetyl-ADP-ribose deacetylase (regulator of RNase III)
MARGSTDATIPVHGDLACDLRVLRERGLIRLRSLDLPALVQAAAAANLRPVDRVDAQDIEQLLRAAVGALGDEESGQAAQYLFGLVQGTIGRRPRDLRERAATIYGLSAETFRKAPERLLIARIAEEILQICHRPSTLKLNHGVSANDVRAEIGEALKLVLAVDDPLIGEGSYRSSQYGPFNVPSDAGHLKVSVRLGHIEEIRGIDVVVASENVYLDPSRTFAPTLSGRLRSAAAVRDETGGVVDDVVARELTEWIASHSRPGRPVEEGIVVATSAGTLAQQDIRRIYHAAVAAPRSGSNHYDVSDIAVRRAVHNIFRLARQERLRFHPPLQSIAIPLFGAGRGGVHPAISFSWIWPAICIELPRDPSWSVCLTAWHAHEAAALLRGLYNSLERMG